MNREQLNDLRRLALMGTGSLAIYYLAFLRPYSLLELWYRPKHNLGSLSIAPEEAHLSYWLAMAALFLFYLLALRISLRVGGRGAWTIILAGVAAYNAMAILLHPFISNDVFDYIIRGRILSVYGDNPFYQVPNDYIADPFYAYSWWRDVPSAYGPLWELLAAGITRLAGDSVVANVIGFKIASIAGHLGTTALVWLMLRSLAPERALYGVAFLGWNPLLVVETAGNAHNDMLMALFVVLAMYLAQKGRFTTSALALGAGALVKFVPALLLPVVMLEAIRRLHNHQARVRFLAVTGAAGVALLVAAYAPFWEGGDIIGVERRTEMFSTSISTLVVGTLEWVMDYKEAARLVTGVAVIALLLWTTRQLRLLWKDHTDLAPARAGLSILLFYLLVSVPWFFQWYLAWPLAIAALLLPGAPVAGATLFAILSSWKPVLYYFFFIMAADAPLSDFIWPEWPVTLLIIVPPIAFFITTWAKRHQIAGVEHAAASVVLPQALGTERTVVAGGATAKDVQVER